LIGQRSARHLTRRGIAIVTRASAQPYRFRRLRGTVNGQYAGDSPHSGRRKRASMALTLSSRRTWRS